MSRFCRYICMCVVCFSMPLLLISQNENDNADITTENVEDKFQDSFYEALRERAIENYSKAIDALKNCKQLDPDNATVDYQLGLNYVSMRNFEAAETYLLTAVEKDPDNRWFADALYNVYESQDRLDEAIAIAERLAETNNAYKKSLVYLYSQSQQYSKALAQLDELDSLYGKNAEREKQRKKFLAYQKHKTNMINDVSVIEADADDGAIEEPEENPLVAMQQQMLTLLEATSYKELLDLTDEALASYPAQPFFYYMNGVAYQKMGEYKKAISSLQTAKDFLIDDVVLEKKIYMALAECHKKLGNIQKEQEYLQKSKNI